MRGRGREDEKGDFETSLVLSVHLSAQRCRERDGAVGSCWDRCSRNQQPHLQPAASALRCTPPRCSGAPLWPRPTTAALCCITASLMLRSAADAPHCGRPSVRGSRFRCLGYPVVRHGKLTLVLKQVHSIRTGYRTVFFCIQSCIQSSSSAYKVCIQSMQIVLVWYAAIQKIQAGYVRFSGLSYVDNP